VRVSLGVKPSLASYRPGTNSALKDKDGIGQWPGAWFKRPKVKKRFGVCSIRQPPLH
jgi:hypothetical protein